MKKKLFLVSCAFATVFGATAQKSAHKAKTSTRINSTVKAEFNGLYNYEQTTSDIKNSVEKISNNKRGNLNVTDTLSIVDLRKSFGRPGRYSAPKAGTDKATFNGLYGGTYKLQPYPFNDKKDTIEYLSVESKFPSTQPVKIKSAGALIAALNKNGVTVDVNVYGKKVAGGQMEYLGTASKTIPYTNGSYSNVWFSFDSPISSIDTFSLEVTPRSDFDTIAIMTTGSLGINNASFKGSISGNTLTLDANGVESSAFGGVTKYFLSGGMINGFPISGPGVAAGTTIVKQTGLNTFEVSISQTIPAGTQMTQNVYPFTNDDNNSNYISYIVVNGQLIDVSKSNLTYDQQGKPLANDAYIYPVVEYAWNTNAPEITVNGSTATAKTTISAVAQDMLFNRGLFFKKMFPNWNKNNGIFFATVKSNVNNSLDTLDNLSSLTTSHKYSTNVTEDVLTVNEMIYQYGYSKRPVALNSSIANVKLCTKPAVPTFTGAAAVCVGATINLTPSATGGTWTSSAATKATVTAGAVKGIAAGTATISYTVGTTGCSTTGTKVITVEAAPEVTISGPAKICYNGRTMMRASVAGGVWNVESNFLMLASPQGLFRNPSDKKPTTSEVRSGVNYTVKSKLGACSTKKVKNVYISSSTAPSITVTAPITSLKVNGTTTTATATTTISSVGTWLPTSTVVSATANANTKTAVVKGLRIGAGANVVYYADHAATGCRQANWLAFNVTAAASMVDANQGSISSTTGVSVYPNPSNGVVTFENIAGAKSISLVDMTGRTVKTVAVNADRMTVNFSGVQNGKYLVQVAGENVNEVRSIVIE